MDRMKMPRQERAKQFAPFDALKGLQQALRIKEYEHERIQKGEVSEEKATEISRALIDLEKGDRAKVVYYNDGHNKEIEGSVTLKIEDNIIEVEGVKINLDELLDIQIKKQDN